MAPIDDLHQLLEIFYSRRYPITFNDLLTLVDYSESTLKRNLRKLRDMNAPLRFDTKTGGYVLEKAMMPPCRYPACGSMSPNSTPCSPSMN